MTGIHFANLLIVVALAFLVPFLLGSPHDLADVNDRGS